MSGLVAATGGKRVCLGIMLVAVAAGTVWGYWQIAHGHYYPQHYFQTAGHKRAGVKGY